MLGPTRRSILFPGGNKSGGPISHATRGGGASQGAGIIDEKQVRQKDKVILKDPDRNASGQVMRSKLTTSIICARTYHCHWTRVRTAANLARSVRHKIRASSPPPTARGRSRCSQPRHLELGSAAAVLSTAEEVIFRRYARKKSIAERPVRP